MLHTLGADAQWPRSGNMCRIKYREISKDTMAVINLKETPQEAEDTSGWKQKRPKYEVRYVQNEMCTKIRST